MAFEKVKRSKNEPVTDTIESEVLDSSDEKLPKAKPAKTKVNNRARFIKSFYVVGFIWFMVVLFALGGIWVPPTLYGLAANFTATALLLGLPNAFATLILLFAAQEFMDLEEGE